MKKKLTIRDHIRIYSVLWMLSMGIILIGSYISEPLHPHWLFWMGFAVFFSAVIYRMVMVKCPHCGSSLSGVRHLPKYCPDCGKPLEDTHE